MILKQFSFKARRHVATFLVWLQILLQIVFPLLSLTPLTSFAGAAESTSSTSHSPFSADRDSQQLPYSHTLSSAASTLASGNVSAAVKSSATGYTASSVQDWLSQFGTAKVNLNVDDSGNWDDSSFDFLMPLYDNQKAVWFTQLGLRAPDGRVTGNVGTGVRTFYLNRWMFGANVFFDDDFTGKNRRVGIGGEAWTDYLKLAANTYLGTTEWHGSRDFDDYYEKPADGFDIRAEGYLPAYPQLGARVMYEQYYGDKVALFDTDHLQSNPSAVTLGLNYTPVPLVTTGIDYKRGQDSMDDLRFAINFTYSIGQSLGSQLSPDQVAYHRSLAGSRYDLVDRNNEIVLQYKKKEVSQTLTDMVLYSVIDNSPADGNTANTVQAHAVTSQGEPAKNISINWSINGHGKLSSATGVTDINGNASVNVTNITAEQVTVSATSGEITRSVPSTFAQSVASLNLKITKNNSRADGSDQDVGQVIVKDASGKALSGVPVEWSLEKNASIVASDAATDSSGKATVHFISTTAGTVKLTAKASDKTESVDASFITQEIANVVVTMTSNNVPADGVSKDVAQATVTDANGKPMAGVNLTWSLGAGHAKTATPVNVTTDASGQATLGLTDTTPEVVPVTASAGKQSGQTSARFSENKVTALSVTMTRDNSAADGVTENIAQATLTDARGNPVPDVPVSWSSTEHAVSFKEAQSTTDQNGHAITHLTSTVPLSGAPVQATASGLSGTTKTSFSAVPVSQIAVVMTTNGAAADGKSQDVAEITVTDANGAPLAGKQLAFNVSGGSAQLSGDQTAQTDAQGKAHAYLTDTAPDTHVVLTATSEGKSGQATAYFVAVSQNITVKMTTDGSPADGKAQNIAQVTVLQAGEPVKGASVQLSKTSSDARFASASATSTNSQGVATLALTDTTAEQFTVTATINGSDTASAQTTFIAPEFGPISLSMPEAGNPAIVNESVAAGGTPVVVAAYNGMAQGDRIVMSSSVAEDAHGKTLPFTSPAHTVSANEVGQDITFTIPEENLEEIEATNGRAATLNVKAVVTQGQQSKEGTLAVPIDTCAPGDTFCSPDGQ